MDAYNSEDRESEWAGFGEEEDLSDLLAEVDRDLDHLAERGDLDGHGQRNSSVIPELPPEERVDIFDPAHNMREVNKQLLLLEDHLFHPPKYCPDCIRKHLMKAEAFADEAYSLDRNQEFGDTLGWLPGKLRGLQNRFISGVDKNTLAQRTRAIRKKLSKETFGVLQERDEFGEPVPVGDEEIDWEAGDDEGLALKPEPAEFDPCAPGPAARFFSVLGEGQDVLVPSDAVANWSPYTSAKVVGLGQTVSGTEVRCIPLFNEEGRGWVAVEWEAPPPEGGESTRWAQWYDQDWVVPVSPTSLVSRYLAGKMIPIYTGDGSVKQISLTSEQLNGARVIEAVLYQRLWLGGPYRPHVTQRGEYWNLPEQDSSSEPLEWGDRRIDPSWGLKNLSLSQIRTQMRSDYPDTTFLAFDAPKRMQLWHRIGLALLVEALYSSRTPFIELATVGCVYTSPRKNAARRAAAKEGEGVLDFDENPVLTGPEAWANQAAYRTLQNLVPVPQETAPARTESGVSLHDLLRTSMAGGAIDTSGDTPTRSQIFQSIPSAAEWAASFAYQVGISCLQCPPDTGVAPEAQVLESPGGHLLVGENGYPGYFQCTKGNAARSELVSRTTESLYLETPSTVSPSAPAPSQQSAAVPSLLAYAFDDTEKAAFEARASSNPKVNETVGKAKAAEVQARSSQRKGDKPGYLHWSKSAATLWEESSQQSGELWPLVRAIGLREASNDIPGSYQLRGELVQRFPGTHWANIANAERAALERQHSRFFLRSAAERGQTKKVLAASLGVGALFLGSLYLKGLTPPGTSGETP
ncbi:hypothetical protein CMI47_09350 [Candidatus Pacearchaeota archaeon]|nr:hypothetical protein [Candidatus Pacearchaeota archaeon]